MEKTSSGNPTTYTYDIANQLKTSADASGTTNYVFDANGNQRTTQSPVGQRTTNSWGYENELRGVASSRIVDHVHLQRGWRAPREEFLGRLHSRSMELAMLTRYLWDYATNTCLAEMDEQGETLVDYTVDPQTGELISERREGESIYHRYDGDGNTRQTADSAGNVLGEATYDAFGETVAESGDLKTTYRFQGQRGFSTDPLTGDVSKYSQTYSPSLGRGLSSSNHQAQENGILTAALDHPTTPRANYSTSLYSTWGAAFGTGLRVGVAAGSRQSYLAAWWQFPPMPFKEVHRKRTCKNQRLVCLQLRDIWARAGKRMVVAWFDRWSQRIGCPHPQRVPIDTVSPGATAALSRNPYFLMGLNRFPACGGCVFGRSFGAQLLPTSNVVNIPFDGASPLTDLEDIEYLVGSIRGVVTGCTRPTGRWRNVRRGRAWTRCQEYQGTVLFALGMTSILAARGGETGIP